MAKRNRGKHIRCKYREQAVPALLVTLQGCSPGVRILALDYEQQRALEPLAERIDELLRSWLCGRAAA